MLLLASLLVGRPLLAESDFTGPYGIGGRCVAGPLTGTVAYELDQFFKFQASFTLQKCYEHCRDDSRVVTVTTSAGPVTNTVLSSPDTIAADLASALVIPRGDATSAIAQATVSVYPAANGSTC